MNLIIRKGTTSDFSSLLGMIQEMASSEQLLERVTNSVEQMEKEKDSFSFLLAEHEGEIIGMAVYFPSYSTWEGKSLTLDDLYVKPAFRSKKVGTQLLKELFTIGAREGYSRIQWRVDAWNTRAKEFYQKIGARMGDQWFNCEFNKDAIQAFLQTVTY